MSLVRILVAAGVFLAVLPVYYLVSPAKFVVPTWGQLGWLVASGVTGIVLGDTLVYESLVKLGPRRTTQLYALQPVVSVIAGYLMGEALGTGMLLGIGVVVAATGCTHDWARVAARGRGAAGAVVRAARVGIHRGPDRPYARDRLRRHAAWLRTGCALRRVRDGCACRRSCVGSRP